MKPIILACLLTFAAGPLVAAHAEGNGPAFPGLQTPDVAISTTAGAGHPQDVTTMDHASVEPQDRVNDTRPAKPGLTAAQEAQREHTWAVLNSNTSSSTEAHSSQKAAAPLGRRPFCCPTHGRTSLGGASICAGHALELRGC